MDQPHFGNLMKSIRDARGLHQADVAELSGTSRKSVFNAESSSECTIRPSTLDLMLSALASRGPLSSQELQDLASATGRTLESFASINSKAGMKPGDDEPLEARAQRAFDRLLASGIDTDTVLILEALANRAAAPRPDGEPSTD